MLLCLCGCVPFQCIALPAVGIRKKSLGGAEQEKQHNGLERKLSDKLLNGTSRSVAAMRASPSQPFLSLSFPSAPSPSLVIPGWAGDELPLCTVKENAIYSRADPRFSISVMFLSPF